MPILARAGIDPGQPEVYEVLLKVEELPVALVPGSGREILREARQLFTFSPGQNAFEVS